MFVKGAEDADAGLTGLAVEAHHLFRVLLALYVLLYLHVEDRVPRRHLHDTAKRSMFFDVAHHELQHEFLFEKGEGHFWGQLFLRDWWSPMQDWMHVASVNGHTLHLTPFPFLGCKPVDPGRAFRIFSMPLPKGICLQDST